MTAPPPNCEHEHLPEALLTGRDYLESPCPWPWPGAGNGDHRTTLMVLPFLITAIFIFVKNSQLTISSFSTWSLPESQKTRQRLSNADRKVFANPENFCDKFIIG